jgi:hypothetical protein
MTIYRGNTPPNIENSYLVNNNILISSNLDEDKEGSKFLDEYIRFINQSKLNVVTFESIQGNSTSTSNSVSISGTYNNFTAYFTETTMSKEDNYTCKTTTVISGELTSAGIKNFTYAFLMLEKNDPNTKLVPIGTIRVFKDSDGLAAKAQWPSSRSSFISNSNAIEKSNTEK